MFSGVKRGSGYIKEVHKGLAEEQLNPHQHIPEGREYKQVKLTSQALGHDVAIWNKADQDLSRVSKLVINNTTYFDASNSLAPSNDKLFDAIVTEMNDSVMEAVGVVNLMQQNVQNGTLEKVAFAKKLPENMIGATDAGHACKSITTDSTRFKLKQEGIFKNVSMKDPENSQYFRYWKAQTVISGTRKDLAEGNGNKLQCKIAWTKEYKNVSDAVKAKYPSSGWGRNADKDTLVG